MLTAALWVFCRNRSQNPEAFQFPQVEEEGEPGEQAKVQFGSSVSVQPSCSWSRTDGGLWRFTPAVKTRKTPAVETNEVYEEIREDEMNSVPVRISTVYSCASFCKPAAADGVYSLAMAALPLDTAEDDLTRPTYTQVNFLNRSSENQLRPSNDLVYSVPRVAVGSHVGGESLYSNTA
ncbi:uncharacterized protein LOC129352907 isoform X3 [Poeciliopsis prolifica]|nr:uncharacterized protein LOC129352907 isoform X3 [Poeciliopsis prolifica]